MTSSTQSDDAATKSSAPGGAKKRRKKKKRKAADLAPVAAAVPASTPRESVGRALAFLLVSIGAALFYVYAAPADTNRPFALVAVGAAAFLCGASPGIDPQRSVAVFGALVAVGLAVIGIRASEIGTVLAMGGGLGLGGGIHRLGRLGPDEGSGAAPDASGSADESLGSATGG